MGLFACLDEMDDDTGFPSLLPPKQKDTPKKEEPADNSPSKAAPSGTKGTPASKSAKGKKKADGDDAKISNNALPKRSKTENVSHWLCLTCSFDFLISLGLHKLGLLFVLRFLCFSGIRIQKLL